MLHLLRPFAADFNSNIRSFATVKNRRKKIYQGNKDEKLAQETRRAQELRRYPKSGVDEEHQFSTLPEKRVKYSKIISWLLRHAAGAEGIPMRADGFAKVSDLLSSPQLKGLNFSGLEDIVKKDNKKRFTVSHEPSAGAGPSSQPGTWWIRANQGHSISSVSSLELKPINSPTDIPMAVHGTSEKAWRQIAGDGLSKMNRNHIHLAQGLAGDGVISGMRQGSQVFIYIDLAKAMADGIKFYLSSNGVVLTEGENGNLNPKYFSRVDRTQKLPGRTKCDGMKKSDSPDSRSRGGNSR